MIKHIHKHIGKKFYVVVFLTFFVSFLEIIMITIMTPIMTILSGQKDKGYSFLNKLMQPTIENYLLIFIAIGILVGIVSYIQGRGIAKVRTNYEYDMRNIIFTKLINANWKYSSFYKNSFMYATVTEEVNRNSMALNYLFSIINLISLTVLYLFSAAIISLKFTVIAFTIFGIVFLLMKSFIKKSKLIGVEMNDTNDAFYNSVNEYLSNIRYIKQNKIESFVINIYQNILIKLRNLRYEGVLKSFTIKAIYDPLVVFIIAVMILVAKNLELNMGEFLVLLVIVYRLAPRTSQLQRDYHEFLLYLPSVKKVEEIIENDNLIKKTDSKFINSNSDNLEVNKLFFNYERFQLNINNFIAKKQNITTIIGKSGSGKTTFVDIISGIRDDYIGDISYPKNMKSSRQIEYVTQDSVLFNTSIYNNIVLNNKVSQEYVIKICKLIGIDGMIESLENKYDHVVKNNGNEFSGGQKQRLMLARALVTNPEILILDESTSALDNKTEKDIMRLLHKLKKELDLIIVMIAHRTSTIVESDYIYILENGKVVLNDEYNNISSNNIFMSFLLGDK